MRRRKRKGLVDERCLSCIYRNDFAKSQGLTTLFCDYIGVTGHSRGCPAGAKCTKYEPGDQIERDRRIRLPGSPRFKGGRET